MALRSACVFIQGFGGCKLYFDLPPLFKFKKTFGEEVHFHHEYRHVGPALGEHFIVLENCLEEKLPREDIKSFTLLTPIH